MSNSWTCRSLYFTFSRTQKVSILVSDTIKWHNALTPDQISTRTDHFAGNLWYRKQRKWSSRRRRWTWVHHLLIRHPGHSDSTMSSPLCMQQLCRLPTIQGDNFLSVHLWLDSFSITTARFAGRRSEHWLDFEHIDKPGIKCKIITTRHFWLEWFSVMKQSVW